jgi:hypothetical protein
VCAAGLAHELSNRQQPPIGRRREAPARKRQIDGKDADADRPKRYEPELEVTAGQTLAEHGARADADTEGRQAQSDHRFTAAEHILREIWQQRQERRTKKPEPRDGEHR